MELVMRAFSSLHRALVFFICSRRLFKVEKTESENKQKYMENKKLTAEIRKAEKRIERAEAEIEKLDSEKAALEEEMNGDAATNYVRLSEISARLAEIEARCDELFLDMEEAEEFLSQNKI